jgi:hypothetical protein
LTYDYSRYLLSSDHPSLDTTRISWYEIYHFISRSFFMIIYELSLDITLFFYVFYELSLGTTEVNYDFLQVKWYLLNFIVKILSKNKVNVCYMNDKYLCDCTSSTGSIFTSKLCLWFCVWVDTEPSSSPTTRGSSSPTTKLFVLYTLNEFPHCRMETKIIQKLEVETFNIVIKSSLHRYQNDSELPGQITALSMSLAKRNLLTLE